MEQGVIFMKKIGRPPKNDTAVDLKEKILAAAVALIRCEGSQSVTVRKVCAKAEVSTGTFYHYFRDKNDLMMCFVKEAVIGTYHLDTPITNITKRTIELYMLLLNRYLGLGKDFMKHFYSTNNISLSAYMGQIDGKFAPGTVMEKNELDIIEAQKAGIVSTEVDAHMICEDICTIVKGCVFEWCLEDGTMDIEHILTRIISRYFSTYLC